VADALYPEAPDNPAAFLNSKCESEPNAIVTLQRYPYRTVPAVKEAIHAPSKAWQESLLQYPFNNSYDRSCTCDSTKCTRRTANSLQLETRGAIQALSHKSSSPN
jgi:hypothetical protein